MIVRQPPRIVVVGAGYAGLGTALRLARQVGARARIDLVDGRSEHQLITRLHEVAAGRLAPAAAAVPLRLLFAGTAIRLHRAWVEGVDLERGRVATSTGLLEYDVLVLAPGSRTDYRDVPGAAELTLPLRTLEDALRLRERVGTHLRRATRTESGLTILVVGGGYTGIELSAELAAWANRTGRRDRAMRIALLEAGPRLLPDGDGWLAKEAAAALERLGVQLVLASPALCVDVGGVQVQRGHMGADLVVWATGVRGPRLLADAGLQVDRDGRALVDRSLVAPGHPEIQVLGDAAVATDVTGARLPATAQLAVQQALCVADNLAAALRGRAAQPFVPRLEGEALSLGPHHGLARIGRVALEDAPAVLVKRAAGARYLYQLGGPTLPLFQCARQHLWDWLPQTPPVRAVEADRSGRGRDAEWAA